MGKKAISYNRRKDMTKKAYAELQKSNRVMNSFNTGTRTMKTDKSPSRAMRKVDFQKRIREEW